VSRIQKKYAFLNITSSLMLSKYSGGNLKAEKFVRINYNTLKYKTLGIIYSKSPRIQQKKCKQFLNEKFITKNNAVGPLDTDI